jgi:GH25 family lysozyme M1 (1,4-beta-N-acetylmuramidase)
MELIDGLEKKGKKVGVYTSPGEWGQVMGAQSNCKQAAKVPLWYATWDGSESFRDYRKIGDWSKP